MAEQRVSVWCGVCKSVDRMTHGEKSSLCIENLCWCVRVPVCVCVCFQSMMADEQERGTDPIGELSVDEGKRTKTRYWPDLTVFLCEYVYDQR